MSECIDINATGNVVFTNQTLEECTSYVLMDSVAYTDYPTLTNIFNMPLASDLGEMWLIGFSLPIIIYLSAWAFGVVISFVK